MCKEISVGWGGFGVMDDVSDLELMGITVVLV